MSNLVITVTLPSTTSSGEHLTPSHLSGAERWRLDVIWVTNLYDLMDAAYDAAEIKAHSEALGHVPIIDVNPRNSAARKRDLQQEAKARRPLGQVYAKDVRYRERSTWSASTVG